MSQGDGNEQEAQATRARSPAEWIGARVAGRFTLLGLASSEQSLWFQARDVDGSPGRLRLIPPANTPHAERLERLEALEHPQLLRVLAAGIDHETGYAYGFQAQSKAAALSEFESLEVEQVAHFGLQSLLALEALAGLGLPPPALSAERLIPLRAGRGDRCVLIDPLGGLVEHATTLSPCANAAALLRQLLAYVAASPERQALLAAAERAERSSHDAAALDVLKATLANLGRAPDEQLLGGRYRRLATLGEGGMGTVFEARDGELKVAVKMLRVDRLDSASRSRFEREAAIASKLESRYIPKLLAVGEHEGVPYLVMELLRGRNLEQLANEVGILEPGVLARIFVEACSGLEVAHAAGLVHRDLKPQNLMLHEEPDGTLVTKVCDFGIAKQVDELTAAHQPLTRSGGFLGTPRFMSPEQAEDARGVDARSDIWSLALSFYELASGTRAWPDAHNLAQLLVALQSQALTPLQELAPWLPMELCAVVHAALEKEPARRTADARTLKEALTPFAAPAPLRKDLLQAWPEALRLAAPRVREEPNALPPPVSRTRRVRWAALGMGLTLVTALAVGIAPRARSPELPAEARTPPVKEPEPARVMPEHPACTREASAEALQRADTVWIGAMFPLAHDDAYMREFGEAAKQAVLLAQREIMGLSGGIPRQDGSKTLPLGLVVCDDAKTPTEVADYLTKQVRVSAVIGFGSSRDVVLLSNQTFVPEDVLVVTALNSSAAVSDIFHAPGSRRLVWRTAANTRGRAAALRRFIPEYLEPRLLRGAKAPLRLALVARHGSAGLSLSADLAKSFGTSAGAASKRGPRERPAPDYKEFHLFEDGETAAAQNRAMSSELRRFKPQVVIVQNSEQAVARDVLLPLEEGFRGPLAERPLYVVTGSLETTGLADIVRRHPTLVDRLYGLTTPTKTNANMQFTRNFNAAFGTAFSLAESPGAPYDSLYLIAYAAARAADPSSGQSLAGAIPSLVGGRVPVDVGASSFLRALSELRAGQTVDLQGAFSTLDFDLATGESQTDYAILCASGEKESFRVLETGLTYRAKEDRFSGKLECKD